jgi:hypothetical protein
MSAADRAADHPSDVVLATWLELGEPASVEDHLSVCDQCAERLESLTDIAGLQDDLATATRPPDDLASRTTVGVKGRLAAQEAVSVVFDMLSLPFLTAAILIGGDDPGGVAVPPRPSDETSDDDGERTDG